MPSHFNKPHHAYNLLNLLMFVSCLALPVLLAACGENAVNYYCACGDDDTIIPCETDPDPDRVEVADEISEDIENEILPDGDVQEAELEEASEIELEDEPADLDAAESLEEDRPQEFDFDPNYGDEDFPATERESIPDSDNDGYLYEYDPESGWHCVGQEEFYQSVNYFSVAWASPYVFTASQYGPIHAFRPENPGNEATMHFGDERVRMFSPLEGMLATYQESKNELKFFQTAEASDPLVYKSSVTIDPTYSCWAGNRFYWLPLVDDQRKLASCRFEFNGSITMGAVSVESIGSVSSVFPPMISMACSPAGFVGLCSTETTFTEASWRASFYDTSSLFSIGPEQLVQEGSVAGLEGAGGRTYFLANENKAIADFEYTSTYGMMQPGPSFIVTELYDMSNPAQAQKTAELEQKLYGVIKWTGDTMWKLENGNRIVRLDFSSLTQTVEVNAFTARNEILAWDIVQDRVFLAVKRYGLQVVDIPATGTPTLVMEKQLSLPFGGLPHVFRIKDRNWVVSNGTDIYLVEPSYLDALPYDPVHRVAFNIQKAIRDGERMIFIASQEQEIQLEIVDFSEPMSPQTLFSGSLVRPISGFRYYHLGDITLDGTTLYIPHETLAALDLSDPTAPAIQWEIHPRTLLNNKKISMISSAQRIGNDLVIMTNSAVQGENNSLHMLKAHVGLPPTDDGRMLHDVGDLIAWNGDLAVAMYSKNGHAVLQRIDFADPLNPIMDEPLERPDISGEITHFMFRSGILYLMEKRADSPKVLHLLDPSSRDDMKLDRKAIPFENYFNDIRSFEPIGQGFPEQLLLSTTIPYSDEPSDKLYVLNVTECK